MKRKLEILAAASGMAEGGDRESALVLLDELHKIKESGKPKFVVIGSDGSITDDVALHLSNLAKRLSSEIVIIADSPAPVSEDELPDGIRKLKEFLGHENRLTYLPALGQMETTVNNVIKMVRRVEFAIVVGDGGRKLWRMLKMPVFSL